VTTQIQEQQVRVTGKSRDDLQAVIAVVRAKDFPVALQLAVGGRWKSAPTGS
jgi:cyclic-di-GMP-binding protein